MSEAQILLSIKDLSIKADSLELIKNYNLELKAGEYKIISAPTGTGKTSLFNYIAGILPEQEFTVTGQLTKAQNLKLSYAFQEPRLIPSLSALKNVMLPLENKMALEPAKETAAAWLEKLNLPSKMNATVRTLSGGEQQRVNLARAFAASVVPEPAEGPALLLLDEPFSSQDEQNALNIKSIISSVLSQNTAVLIISHERIDIAARNDMFFKL